MPDQCATAAFSAGSSELLERAADLVEARLLRVGVRARPARRRACDRGPGLTLAVALMQPAPPSRMLASRNVSLPAKTSKPAAAKRSSIAFVLFQSPEESFTPAIVPG